MKAAKESIKQSIIEEYVNDIRINNTARSECNFAFDFNSDVVIAISVERVHVNEINELTAIGYYFAKTPEILKEWYFRCTHTQHNNIVGAFYASKEAANKVKKTAKEQK